METLIDATKRFYDLLNEKKATYSNGKFIKKEILMKDHKIPADVIVEENNNGKILDIYASNFTRIPHMAVPFLEKEIQYGTPIMPHGYTFVDLSVPKPALYGQINPVSEKKDMLGEHFKVLMSNQKKEDLYSYHSEMDEKLEKARSQKDISPRERIGNARKAIENADLGGSLESAYLEQKKALEEGAPVANKVLHGIANGRWMLTNAGNDALPEEDFKKLFAIYSGADDLELLFGKANDISEKLNTINSCKELLQRYNLQENDINAILNVRLRDLPTAWIEVK